MRPAIVLTPVQRLIASHQRRMRAVRELQERSSNEPVIAAHPLGVDRDKTQTGEPPPGWPGTGYTAGSAFRWEF